MAFLLMFQKFELIRKISEYELEDNKLSREVELVGKQIKSREKCMAAKREKTKRDASNFKNMFTQYLQMQTGLSSQTLLPTMIGSGGIGAMSPFINKCVQEILSSDQMAADRENLKALYEAKLNGTLVQNLDENNSVVAGKEWKINGTTTTFSNEQYNKISEIINNANYAQSMKMQENQMMTSQVNNMVSIWEEAEMARLDAEEEAMLEPLAEKERNLKMDKEWCEAELERLKAFKQSIDQKVAEDLKESVPKFGLA